jgi:hypothetical protein
MLTILWALILGPVFVSSKVYTADVPAQKQLWENFKRQHNRWYNANEEKYRFANFVQNLKKADELQSKEILSDDEDTVTFGVNRFSDMNQVRTSLKIPCNLANLSSARPNSKCYI